MPDASTSSLSADDHVWWCRSRPYTRLEIACDVLVHCLGLLLAAGAGGALLVMAALWTAPAYTPAVAVYVGSLLILFSISLAFNTAPIAPVKRLLARLDQAAIFLLIAATYTPILSILSGTTTGNRMLALVWGASVIGIALKLLVPQHFGRLAIVLYAAIGWSGVAVFSSLAQALPQSTLWLLLAGGIAYSTGIIFHVWEKLFFHNVVWHCFVVAGASLHLWAVLDCMVIRRL